ncbi:hypothetical protein JCM10212_003903 [Sporobolomyces blumeae]
MLAGTKKDRRQPTRHAPTSLSSVLASSEYSAKRIRRHLVDLDRTNYTESSTSSHGHPGSSLRDPGQGGDDDDNDDDGGDRFGQRDEGGSIASRRSTTTTTTGGGGGGGIKKGPSGQSKNVRTLLVYRKTLAQLVEESNLPKPVAPPPPPPPSSSSSLVRSSFDSFRTSTPEPSPTSLVVVPPPSTYLTISSPPSRFPPVQMCTVCGYKGKYSCTKCGSRYCDLGCKVTHEESRCERR